MPRTATGGHRKVVTTPGFQARLGIGEAPLFISTKSGVEPAVTPEDIDMWGYWYGSSERPDVRVREILSEDGMGTAYWRFSDTYAYQIGEPADGDKPGDIKWEFGGAVLRTVSESDPIKSTPSIARCGHCFPRETRKGRGSPRPSRTACPASASTAGRS